MGSISKNVALLTLGFWLGCAVLFAAVVAPTLFNPDVASGLTRNMAGAISGAILRRVFFITYICGGVAIFFLFLASLGGAGNVKGARRALVLCILMLGLNAINDLWILDRLNKLKLQKTNATGTKVETLQKDFDYWHKISIGVYGSAVFFGAMAAIFLLPAGSGGKSRKPSK